MERFLRQFIHQYYLMSTLSTCLLLVLVFALLFYCWQRVKLRSSFEYFTGMPSTISSLMSLWTLNSLRRPPRLTSVNEVNLHNQCTSYQMTYSLSLPSSSSHTPKIKYDLFISFRGSDTRRGFLSHLLKALSHAKIEAYVDYKLREGNELLPALFTAIEESQIALIIFSKDYASSKWCLEELVKITECMMKNGQIVVPIFYDVDPSDVRHQKGCYKSAFAKHEKLFKGNIMNVEKWRTTLKKVSNLSGFHSSNFGTEAKLIEVVVQRVLTRLDHMPEVDLKGLVGIDKPIADLQSLISCNGSEDVRVIGIWGTGGIGKTTIASVLFNIVCSTFEGCCFLSNVREQSEKLGVIRLRDKLLSILLEEKDLDIGTSGVPAHVLRRLRRKKILVVLDDVNNQDEVIDLIGGHYWLGPGSRIIITTRDKHVICKANDIYEVELLGFREALQLLNLHAFDGKCLQMNWQNLMLKVVDYAKGIPLALKVLGSFLYGKTAEEWESQLQKLQKMPFPKIQHVLKLSYDGLDREDSSIFLYIACFFQRCVSKDDVKNLIDACGYSTSIGLRNLQDKSLIEVSSYGDLSMHDLIREMGREVVREQHIERLGERSHLWDPNDIYCVLKHDEGTEHIETITLDMSRISDLSLKPHSFARMVKLNFLRFQNYSISTHSRVHLPDGLGPLSNNLRLFHWDEYPLKSLPATLNAENLVELCMQGSHVEKLWDGVQNLKNLKKVDLDGSEQLLELPDFSKASNLEYLCMDGCKNLLSVHPSIFSLQSLESVYLRDCQKVEKLSGDDLSNSDRFHWNLDSLDLGGCQSLKNLTDSLPKMRSLLFLFLEECKQIDTSSLQIILDGLSSLTNLYLDSCHNLFELPENISKCSSLLKLSLKGTNIKSFPESIKHLPRLLVLNLSNCRRLQSIPEIPASLYLLYARGCTSLERVFTPTPELLEQHVRLANVNYNFKASNFSFYDCPNLDKHALDAILEYVECCNERKRATYPEKRLMIED